MLKPSKNKLDSKGNDRETAVKNCFISFIWTWLQLYKAPNTVNLQQK